MPELPYATMIEGDGKSTGALVNMVTGLIRRASRVRPTTILKIALPHKCTAIHDGEAS